MRRGAQLGALALALASCQTTASLPVASTPPEPLPATVETSRSQGLSEDVGASNEPGIPDPPGRWVEIDLALATATADAVRADDARYAGANAIDRDPRTYWTTDDGVTAAELTIELPEPAVFDRLVLSEPAELGARVLAFAVDARSNGAWQEIAHGDVIPTDGALPTQPVRGDAVRLRVLDARACPVIDTLRLFRTPPRASVLAPATTYLGGLEVEIATSLPGAEVYYSLDGSEPTRSSTRCDGPLRIAGAGPTTLRARAWFVEQAGDEVREDFFGYTNETLVPPDLETLPLDPGLTFTYYEGAERLADLSASDPIARGVWPTLDLGPRRRDEGFALVFEGYVRIDVGGVWTLAIEGTDEARVGLGGTLLRADGGVAAEQTLGLHAGWHEVSIALRHETGPLRLTVELEGPGIARGTIAADALRH